MPDAQTQILTTRNISTFIYQRKTLVNTHAIGKLLNNTRSNDILDQCTAFGAMKPYVGSGLTRKCILDQFSKVIDAPDSAVTGNLGSKLSFSCLCAATLSGQN
jgi:hypothetical protein